MPILSKAPAASNVDIDAGHGRIETRSVRVSDDIQWLQERHPHWVGLKSIIAASAIRELKDKRKQKPATLISSLDGSTPARLGSAIRK